MFFIISKLLLFLIKPTFWILSFLISALLFKKYRKKLIIISIVIFWFFGNGFIVDEFYRLWEVEVKAISDLDKKYDYAIVLGGFSGYDEDSDRIEFNNCGDRVFYAIQMYNLGKIDKILISGGNGMLFSNGYKEAEWTHKYLINCGIPKEDILLESESRNTIENVKYTFEMVKGKENKILLITSAWHMKRASFCFSRFYKDFDAFSTDYTKEQRNFHLDYMILPIASSFEKWEILMKEWIGLVVYKILY